MEEVLGPSHTWSRMMFVVGEWFSMVLGGSQREVPFNRGDLPLSILIVTLYSLYIVCAYSNVTL